MNVSARCRRQLVCLPKRNMDFFISTLFLLLFGHALADYALQSKWMAIGKNPNNIPRNDTDRRWYHKMAAHCIIHGGFVYLFTVSINLGIIEFIAHWMIDILKCDKKISPNVDQALHILCKIGYAAYLLYALT